MKRLFLSFLPRSFTTLRDHEESLGQKKKRKANEKRDRMKPIEFVMSWTEELSSRQFRLWLQGFAIETNAPVETNRGDFIGFFSKQKTIFCMNIRLFVIATRSLECLR
jgi:hypothetical protein